MTSLAAHTLVNGLLYDTSSITGKSSISELQIFIYDCNIFSGGYFINNVQDVSYLREHCSESGCWSVHVSSLLALSALLVQICSVFAVKKILFKTKYYSDECISMSHYPSE